MISLHGNAPLYVPILKWKRGEQLAVQALKESTRHRVMPLVEVQPPPVDWERSDEEGIAYSKSLREHLQSVAAATAKFCDPKLEIAVDQPLFEEDSVEGASTAWAFLFESLWAGGVAAIPVISNSASTAEVRAIKTLARSTLAKAPERYVLRYRFGSENTALPPLAGFGKWLRSTVNDLEASHQNVDVVLDMGYVGTALPNDVESGIVERCATALVVAALQGPWRSITIAAGAFPENLAAFRPGIARLPRLDWQLYQAVVAATDSDFRPAYGDYGVSYTDAFEVNPRMMRMSANLRYTHFDHWYVYKARNVKEHGFGQYQDLCGILVNSLESPFMGEDFSAGDKNFAALAKNLSSKPGNATIWRRDATNHHIELAVHQLSTMPDSLQIETASRR
jgi:hypothetical protein